MSHEPARLMLATVSGHPLRLDGLEFAEAGIGIVACVELDPAAADALVDAFEAELAEAPRRGGDVPVPDQPATRLLSGLDVAISDRHGTDYRLSRRSFGGTGREWCGTWTFEPAPPTDLATLTVTVGSEATEVPLLTTRQIQEGPACSPCAVFGRRVRDVRD